MNPLSIFGRRFVGQRLISLSSPTHPLRGGLSDISRPNTNRPLPRERRMMMLHGLSELRGRQKVQRMSAAHWLVEFGHLLSASPLRKLSPTIKGEFQVTCRHKRCRWLSDKVVGRPSAKVERADEVLLLSCRPRLTGLRLDLGYCRRTDNDICRCKWQRGVETVAGGGVGQVAGLL